MRAAFFQAWAVAALLMANSIGPITAAEPLRLVVSAGDFNRQQTVVSFKARPAFKNARAIADERGTKIPLQISDDGQVSFIVSDLPAHSTRSFIVSDSPLDATPLVQV